MTDIITPTKSQTSQTFTVAGSFTLFCEGFKGNENAALNRPNQAGDGYTPVTSRYGVIKVSEYPNTVYCELPAGTYQIVKSPTEQLASVSYTEV